MLTVFNGYTTHTNGALGDGLLLLFHVFFFPHCLIYQPCGASTFFFPSKAITQE